LVKLIGASAMTLALCASAPHGALAQAPAAAPDAATSGAAEPSAAATQNAPPAVLGSSIRKPPSATSSGAPAAAYNTAASSASALPSSVAPAAEAGAPASAGATSFTAPVTTESAGAPAALATRATQAKGGRRAHPDDATQSASAKTDSTDTRAAKDDKNSKGQESPFSSLQFSGNKGPIDIKSDALDLDYKGNIVTFRGHVHATQADATLTSDTLRVAYGKDFHEVKEMVANSNVRMSQGTRWATGDHAVLDQAKHTVTLTGSPVVHDGEDQVTGSKITVHLDTGKSEVEGARAVFFPKDQKTRDNKTTVAKSP
jgi:lipopolysaccharide export system protein LptA